MATYVDIDLESPTDLSAFTTTATQGAATLANSTSGPIHGSRSLLFTWGSSGDLGIAFKESVTQASDAYFRVYINLSATQMAFGGSFEVMLMRGAFDNRICWLEFHDEGASGVTDIEVHGRISGNTNYTFGTLASKITQGTAQCWELRYVQHASTGGVELWLDGSKILSVLNQNTSAEYVDTYCVGPWDYCVQYPEATSYIRFDSIKAADSYIGLLGGSGPIYSAARRWFAAKLSAGGALGDRRSERSDTTSEPPEAGTYATSVTRGLVTWTFDTSYRVGTFANGDPWVVGPVRLTGPESTLDGGRRKNGTMINPRAGYNVCGYDSECGGYDAGLNIGIGMTPSTPVEVAAGSSVLSAVSNAGTSPRLYSIEVLTVVSTAPPPGAFRPSGVGLDKSASYNISQLRTELLGTLTPVGTPESWSTVNELARYSLFDFANGWERQNIYETSKLLTYGANFSKYNSVIMLKVNSDYPLSEKLESLYGLVQRGIDLWGCYQDYLVSGGEWMWGPDGGHSHGRKALILFAGYMLNDAGMLGIGSISDVFHEDAQTFYLSTAQYNFTDGGMTSARKTLIQANRPTEWATYVANYPVNAAKTGLWEPGADSGGYQPYSSDMVGMPEWDGAAVANETNAHWLSGNGYRLCCNQIGMTGWVLCLLELGLVSAYNHDALFDYQRRYIAVESAETDPYGVGTYGSVDGVPGSPDTYRYDGMGKWAYDMWQQYAEDYFPI